jgi:cation diffusion facilitator family transporter
MSDTDEPKNAIVVDIETDNNLSEKKDEGTSENNLNSSISNTAADEVAESSSDNEADTAEWRVLSRPSSLDMSKSPILKKANYNRVAAYYKRENGLISAYQNIAKFNERSTDELNNDITKKNVQKNKEQSLVESAITISFFSNIFLFIIKIIAAISTGSLSVIASTVDSVLDLLAGLVIYCITQKMKVRDPIHYPQGKTRLEPLGVIIFACIMSVSMMSLVQTSAEVTIRTAQLNATEITPTTFDPIGVSVLGITMVVKTILALFCWWVGQKGQKNPSVNAYSEDHRNDVLTNGVALICWWLSTLDTSTLWWFDPLGAVLICIYIIVNWISTAQEQIANLTGISAPPEFLNRLTYMAVNHDRKIVAVDTVRAYHFGNQLLVEVDIVLPEDMSLKEAHDIGESLQIKLEDLEEVERAFVHLDWEFEHAPEHKKV